MASAILEIVPAQYAPSSVTALYTAPSGVTTRIDKLTCTNSDSGPQQITIYLVPSGGSPDGSNVTSNGVTILAGKTFNSPNEYGHYLNPGDAIYVLSSSASTINILVGGTLVGG